MFEYELEAGHDREYECEYASEYESEQFLPLLGSLVAKVAPMAIQAIGGLISNSRRKHRGKRQREFEFELEFESESEYEIDPYIAKLLKSLGTGVAQGEGESEAENELESAPMSEYEVMMESLAYTAAESESEAEAEAFIGALVPVAARLFPKASAQVISAITPSLIQGVAQMARVLHKSPKTRPLLRTVPQIVKVTLGTLANQAPQDKPLSRTTTLRVLAGQTAKVLDNPNKVTQVMRKSHRAQHQHRAMNTQAQHQAKAMNNGKRRRAYA
ncbi:hypothetical protein [Brasilonema sp. UFV-L1]|uniref:hypothetical protein n=1 Tax=Brasilonema sp. UFV-L1 TaxID=2234130 RepID=UPI00145E084B|nr:hypothetical protein [Brasilonema sp. UFV-L1]NMG10276.1 hypothetical protein [Brasilonema sp. UFV-L1]